MTFIAIFITLLLMSGLDTGVRFGGVLLVSWNALVLTVLDGVLTYFAWRTISTNPILTFIATPIGFIVGGFLMGKLGITYAFSIGEYVILLIASTVFLAIIKKLWDLK